MTATIQQLLPIFKDGANLINNLAGYQKKKIYYYVGQAIIGVHDEKKMNRFVGRRVC